MKRLLLVGGGHSHVEVVRRFGIEPPAGVEVRLVSPDRHASYSGMLPGLVAGHYAFDDCHIDLDALCRSAGTAFTRTAVEAIDLARGTARLSGGAELPYDVLSLDIGSTPATAGAPGVAEHAVRVKPVSTLLEAWRALRAASLESPQRVTVVGGGAGGVELAFAMHQGLESAAIPGWRVSIVTDTPTILPGFPAAARRVFERLAAARGLALNCGDRVTEVLPGQLRLESGRRLESEWIVWTTFASAAGWITASGLATDARGFVTVDDTLQSPSHPNVFAAGDCASLANHAVPKSGVYAVRQGPVLAANLRSALGGGLLARYRPQRVALALISTGDRYAVAKWNGFTFKGAWVWRWKDRIDRRFMARYRAIAAPS